jgi:hypothetical protein
MIGPLAPEKKIKNAKEYLKISCSQPYIDSPNCYVNYGIYDGLDTYLAYGFYHKEAPYLRSIPVTIPIKDCGSLIINSYTASKINKKLHKHLEDIKAFMPIVTKQNENSTELNCTHLFIGLNSAPNLLRRILRILIRSLAGDKVSQKFVVDRTYEAEQFIIDKNINFYKTLLNKIDGNTSAPDDLKEIIKETAQSQLIKLYKYQFNDEYFVINDENLDNDVDLETNIKQSATNN